MSYSGKIAPHDAVKLLLDENREPIIECNWNKRRKCDSYYIELYKQQQKRIEKALEYIEKWISYDIKDDDITGMNNLLKILKGENNE